MRDLYRPGGGESRLTLRLMWVLVRALPQATEFTPGALLWHALKTEQEASLTSVERLRARQALYSTKGGDGEH